MTLGELIRHLRKAKSWTQEKLSEESGIDQVTISHIETGRIKRTSLEKMAALANALDVRVNKLLEAAGIIEPNQTLEESETEFQAMINYLRSDLEFMRQVKALGGNSEQALMDIADSMKSQLRAVLRAQGVLDDIGQGSNDSPRETMSRKQRTKVG